MKGRDLIGVKGHQQLHARVWETKGRRGKKEQSVKMCTSENVTMELVMTYTNLFSPRPSLRQHRLNAESIILYQFTLSASIGWALIFLTTFSIPKPNYVQLYVICITFKSMSGEIQVRP